MTAYRQWVPAHLRFLLAVHVLLLAIYTAFRYVTLAYNRPSYFFDAERSISLWKAFRIGFGFDITVASYALLPPYLALTYAYFRQVERPMLYRYVRIYCGVAILISLILCAADVPYFKFFNVRLNTAMVHLKNLSQSGAFIVKEIKYWPFIALLIAGFWGIRRLTTNLWNRTWSAAEQTTLSQRWLATSLASLIMVVTLWGGPVPRKLDMKSATFSNDGFINQLTLNPVHTWFDSYFAFDINVFGMREAKRRVQNSLGIQPEAGPGSALSPVARTHHYNAPARPMNVVLVLMESMSADRMGIFGNTQGLTPNLDRLARNSVLFDNCYSNGIHTNVGIYSSLYGMPAMMMEHPMLTDAAQRADFTGLPVTLREQGYRTRFFCTHPKTFDNLDIFLQKNGIEYISDQSDYAPTEIANSWGVGDESLAARAFSDLDSLANAPDGRPFFATVLTITTHPPFTLPPFSKFKPRNTDPILATYEYSDWAISNFIEQCSTQPWYNNTIFVLVGDHGANLPGYPTDVPLSYNHVPLIVHAPGIFKKPEVRHGLANQTDIFPTVMGLLQRDYVQNTLGYDLFREQRPVAFFSQDQRLCAVTDRYLYVARKSGSESLYDYRSGNPDDIQKAYPALADSLKNYACSQLQVAQWMVENGLVGKQRVKK